LEGTRILAVEQFIAGPYGTMLLADFGAEVIKIEAPGTGDGYRNMMPYVENERGRSSYGLLRMNRNKKSLTLDLQKEEGREIFKRLVQVADVVWENLRPGVMDRLGLGYPVLHALNPALIYASVSGFGHADIYQSPFVEMPAFDIIAQAMAGLMLRAGQEGDPPLYSGLMIGDLYPSVLAAFGVLLALLARHSTGQGQRVDIAMYDAMLTYNEYAIGLYSLTGQRPPRALVTSAPYGPFKARDGYVVISVVSEPIWARFCRALQREDLLEEPSLRTGMDRAKRVEDFLRPLIEDWAKDKTRAQVVEILNRHGVPACPVQDVEDILACPHVRARRMLLSLDDPVAGQVKVVGNAIKLSEAPDAPAEPPPQLGQHTEQLLSKLLGMSGAELARLRQAGVI